MRALEHLLADAVRHGATDVRLVTGHAARLLRHTVTLSPPEVHDSDPPLAELAALAADELVHAHVLAVETAAGRARVQLMRHAGGLAATLRPIPATLPAFATLALPSVPSALIADASGLVLVAGARGSGRSTSLAMMLQHRLATRRGHALTIEHPLEHVIATNAGHVTQRAIGPHTPSLHAALDEARMQDVDTLLLADLPDADVLLGALAAAESGALVLAAVPGPDATRALDGVLRLVPARRLEFARARLAEQLRVVVAQHLVRGAASLDVHLASEVLVNTATVAGHVRQGRLEAMPAVIAAGGRAGHRALDHALLDLVARDRVTRDEALHHAVNPSAFAALAPPEAA